MYKSRHGQTSLFDEPKSFIGAKLDPENRWIKMAQLIPWEEFDELYSKTFEGSERGNVAKESRMALGALIIRERKGLSDADTVLEIQESPYLQWFIGLSEFTNEAPFDACSLTRFRKRVTPEMLILVNDYVTGRKKKRGDNDPFGSSGGNGSGDVGEREESKEEEKENKGTFILDATCAPSDIRFPTDVSLLSEAREKAERLIDSLYERRGVKGDKPRTYRQQARQDYLRFARNRKPTKKNIRSAIRKQLGYLGRNLRTIESMGEAGLSPKEEELLFVLKTVHSQQGEMYREKKHQVADRIVSISQHWVRPIVRGKTNAPTEFGAKISISMIDGYAFVERLSWDAYSEGGGLIETIERYKEAAGFYPERILADKAYRTRANLQYCKKHGIAMNGPKLGRPPKDKKVYRAQCLLEKKEAGERNAVEGKFGEGKRTYSLGRIMARRQDTSETSIHMAFLMMNLMKGLRSFAYSIWGCYKIWVKFIRIESSRRALTA